jgi:hypothetical protein
MIALSAYSIADDMDDGWWTMAGKLFAPTGESLDTDTLTVGLLAAMLCVFCG